MRKYHGLSCRARWGSASAARTRAVNELQDIGLVAPPRAGGVRRHGGTIPAGRHSRPADRHRTGARAGRQDSRLLPTHARPREEVAGDRAVGPGSHGNALGLVRSERESGKRSGSEKAESATGSQVRPQLIPKPGKPSDPPSPGSHHFHSGPTLGAGRKRMGHLSLIRQAG